MVAGREGTVGLRRRSRSGPEGFRQKGLFPESKARLLGVGFQGDVKKVQVELAPLRWDDSEGPRSVGRCGARRPGGLCGDGSVSGASEHLPLARRSGLEAPVIIQKLGWDEISQTSESPVVLARRLPKYPHTCRNSPSCLLRRGFESLSHETLC